MRKSTDVATNDELAYAAYEKGRGVPKDEVESLRFLVKAASGYLAGALGALGLRVIKESIEPVWWQVGAGCLALAILLHWLFPLQWVTFTSHALGSKYDLPWQDQVLVLNGFLLVVALGTLAQIWTTFVWGYRLRLDGASKDLVITQPRLFGREVVDAQGLLGGIARAPFAADFPLQIYKVLTFTEQDGKTVLEMGGGPLEATEAECAFFAGMNASMQGGFKGTFDLLAAYLAEGEA